MAQAVKQKNKTLKPTEFPAHLRPTTWERPVVNEALLAAMTERIVTACQPEKVVLFGSYAYGTPHENSDVDLFVIMKPKYPEETNHQRVMRVTDVAKVPYLPMDVIVRTPEEVKKRLNMGDFFIREICERGKVLYERDSTGRVD
jgi:predicted nucleotidyltransferase